MFASSDAEIIATFWTAALAAGNEPYIYDATGDGTDVSIDTSGEPGINLIRGLRAVIENCQR